MPDRLTPATAAALALAISFAAIVSAWGFEIIGGYIPCALCLQQRWPYYIAVPLLLGLWLAARRMPGSGLVRGGLVLAALIMVAGGGIGVYQSGAEWGFWSGPDACGAGAGLSGGLPNLDTARVIRCDEAQLRVLGLSFAGWNVVVSLAVAAIALAGAWAPRQGSSSLSQYR